uniref:Anoct_dimer domain-containing protein n=1 Tax=Anopheles funestus TaxID=62324 RepID=A0A182RJT0_ANOFN
MNKQRSHSCRDSRALIYPSRKFAGECNGVLHMWQLSSNFSDTVAVVSNSAKERALDCIETQKHCDTRNDSSSIDGYAPISNSTQSRSLNSASSRMATNSSADGSENFNHFSDAVDVGGHFDVLLPNCIVQQEKLYDENTKTEKQTVGSRTIHSSPVGKARSRRYSQDSCAPIYERLSVAGFVRNGTVNDSCQNFKLMTHQHQILMRHSTDNLRSINNHQGTPAGGLCSKRETVEMTAIGFGTEVGTELTNHGKTKYIMHRMTAQDLGSGNEPSSSQDSTASPSSTILPKPVEIVVENDSAPTNGYPSMVNGSTSNASPKDTNFIDKLPPLEDIMESPMLKTPVEKWLETEDRLSSEEIVPPYGTEEPSRSNLFGPKISASENIPGTPMDTPDIVSEFNKSFNSSTTSIINERRRSSSKLLGLATADRDPASVGGIGTGTHSSMSDHPKCGTAQGGQNFGGTSVDKNNSLSKGSLRNLLKLRKASDQSQDTRRSSQQDKEGLDPESLMFRDGRRKIDMVLCYEEDDQGVMTELDALKRHQRKLFHENLIREGLEFEVEDKAQAFDGKTYFVKIHIPWRTESRLCWKS